MPSIPVIFLAFANEKQSEVRYLRALAMEQAFLKEALEPAVAAGLCELVVESNATISSIIDTFQRTRYRDRIAIFHYGGHADGYQLLLESLEGGNSIAHGLGLVSFLSKQPALRLIFLNGCSTQQQAEELVKAGVPAVIGTSQSIADEVATQLATRFYQSIGQGASLDRAWREAEDEIKIRSGDSPKRDFLFHINEEDPSLMADHFPWNIYHREGAEIVREWNLPQAAGNPLFGLPDLSRDFDLPEEPYRFLRRFERRHAEVFFGRGTYIRDVYQRLRDPHAAPVLLLYGQSGVGKSSLLEAGLLPRLEQNSEVFYLRRDPAGGLINTLKDPFDSGLDASALKTAWLEREQNNGRPLVIILDQVEETFTRPRAGQAEELPEFMAFIRAIFEDPTNRPAGRLLLSYRKEYHPEIEAQCRQLEIPREKIYIDKLNRKDIIEVVNGLTSTERLRRRYGLQVEDALPQVIANDLLGDPNSAIAPVLQILLTKMWDLTEAEGAPHFTVAKYHELRKAGILLDDFYAEQMAQLQAWKPEVVDSGLALDLLHLHTTGMGTAGSRDLEEIRNLYNHRADLLDQLLARLKNLYLLTEVKDDAIGLTHDALAPIVQREIKDSDKPGQRALRILNSKMPEYTYSPDTVYIDEEDLMLVERGAAGMRLWTVREQELIEKSRERRAKLVGERRRNRRLKIVGVISIGILLIISSLFWYRSDREARFNQTQASVNAGVNAALDWLWEKNDATIALNTINEALKQLPTDDNALRVRNNIFSENEFYKASFPSDSIPFDVYFSPDATQFLYAAGSQAFLQDTFGTMITSIQHGVTIRAIALSPSDDNLIVTGGGSEYEGYHYELRIWDFNGRLKSTLTGHTNWVNTVAWSPDGQYILSGSFDGEVILWRPNGELVKRWRADPQKIHAIAFAPGKDLVATAGTDSTVYVWDYDGNQKYAFLHGSSVYALTFHPEENILLSGNKDGVFHLWDLRTSAANAYFGHDQSIRSVDFSPDGQYILTAGEDRLIKLWQSDGSLIKVYRGHSGYVYQACFSSDGQFFLSCSEDKTIKWWKRDSKVFKERDNGLPVWSTAICPDGEHIFIGSGEDMEGEEEVGPDNAMKVWNIKENTVASWIGHEGAVTSIAISGDGSMVLSGGLDNKLILWDHSGGIIHTLVEDQDGINAVAFSGDDRLIASAGSDGSVNIWNMEGQLLQQLNHPDWVNDLAFSANGGKLLVACDDGNAYLWTVGDTLKNVIPRVDPDGIILAVAYALREALFAIGETTVNEGIVSLMDENGQLVAREFLAFEDPQEARMAELRSLAFSKDGSYLLAGGAGGNTYLFSLSPKLQLLYTLHDSRRALVNDAGMSNDNELILIGDEAGKVRLFFQPNNQF